MVPEALAGPGSRGARLGPHGKRVARRGAQRRSGHDRSIAHCFGVGPALSALTPIDAPSWPDAPGQAAEGSKDDTTNQAR